MILLGEYGIPSRSFDESIELSDIIMRSFGGEVSRRSLAEHLGMSERGGAFSARIGALRQWGLAEGRSVIKLTESALCLTSSRSDSEKCKATLRSMSNVPLFLELLKRMSKFQLDKAKIGALTREITGEHLEKIKRYEPLVERTFLELKWKLDNYGDESASKRVFSQSDTLPGGNSGEIHSRPEPLGVNVPSPAKGRVKVYFAESVIDLEENPENLDAVMLVIWAKRNRLTAESIANGQSIPPSVFKLSNTGVEDGDE